MPIWRNRMDDIDEFAFPLKHVGPGMSLRDYFAARAMQSFVQSATFNGLVAKNKQFAEAAYEMADAMLKERSK